MGQCLAFWILSTLLLLISEVTTENTDRGEKCNLKKHITLFYSQEHNSTYDFCFMKQNCHFQRCIAQCKHTTMPLSSYSINTTHQGFQKRYITLFYLKGLKSYQPSKFKCLHFTPFSLVNRTFHLHF